MKKTILILLLVLVSLISLAQYTPKIISVPNGATKLYQSLQSGDIVYQVDLVKWWGITGVTSSFATLNTTTSKTAIGGIGNTFYGNADSLGKVHNVYWQKKSDSTLSSGFLTRHLGFYTFQTKLFTKSGNYLFPATLNDSIGIGTATPSAKLGVWGSTLLTGKFENNNGNLGILTDTNYYGIGYKYASIGYSDGNKIAGMSYIKTNSIEQSSLVFDSVTISNIVNVKKDGVGIFAKYNGRGTMINIIPSIFLIGTSSNYEMIRIDTNDNILKFNASSIKMNNLYYNQGTDTIAVGDSILISDNSWGSGYIQSDSLAYQIYSQFLFSTGFNPQIFNTYGKFYNTATANGLCLLLWTGDVWLKNNTPAIRVIKYEIKQ